MKKKKRLKITILFLLLFVLCVIGYFTIGIYYQDNFVTGTYINGIYCTGKSIVVINEELQENKEIPFININDGNGNSYFISLQETDYHLDYWDDLKNIIEQQNAYVWITRLIKNKYFEIKPKVSFSKVKLKEAIRKSGIFEANHKENVVYIQKEGQYILIDGMRDVLFENLLFDTVIEAILHDMNSVDIRNCYGDLPYTEQMLKKLELFTLIDQFQNCNIKYDMGDQILTISPEIAASFIMSDKYGNVLLDDNNQILIDEANVEKFVDSLIDQYDTLGKIHSFHTTKGDNIFIEGGTYGTKINKEKEMEYLLNALNKGNDDIHIPYYEKVGLTRGKNDIGDTYIEVDMSTQKMMFYKDGILTLETDVVTGNHKKNNDTPTGVYFVYYMQKDRTLHGANYETFVKYWIAINNKIGIHDASWRKEFGGEIYKKGGSHGCINVPTDVMPLLYDNISIGIPVIIYE